MENIRIGGNKNIINLHDPSRMEATRRATTYPKRIKRQHNAYTFRGVKQQ